ncbi:hypothetical protein HYW68_02445 [Candidatus Parcubacteria bacterium]|nr:hypothetical protein [Candidatus Parcubacteria bacterium]
MKPPYPRFIRDYLMGLWDTWFSGPGLALARLFDLKRPAHEWKLFDRVIHAFVTWGLGNRLTGNREVAAEVIPRLTALLADHGFNPASIFVGLPTAYDPIEDLSYGIARVERDTLVRASASLLALQYGEKGRAS